jgi:prepilin-type N-terminal cleavage/methylation domain-containing protein
MLIGKPIRGFSMLEMVVAMAILVVLAAVVVPSTAQYSRDKEIQTTAATFNELADSIKSFKTVVTMYPGKLSQLTTKVAPTGDLNGCGAAFGTTPAGKWINPFWDALIPTQGFKLPIGVANDQLTRTTGTGVAGLLQITVPNVPYDVALDLNTVMDGPNDPIVNRSSTTGMIRYGVPNASELVSLTYSIGTAKTC